MAHIFADRIKETSTTVGTITFVLTGAATKYRAFSAVASNNDTVYYVIVNQSADEWEVGLGTWTTGNNLSRDTVYTSSTGSKVNFTSGTKEVSLTLVASHLQPLGIGDSPQFTKVGAGCAPAYGIDSETAVGTTFLKCGSSYAVYLMGNSAGVGFNAYESTGWKFGKGSTSKYGGYLQWDHTNNLFALSGSTATGNADGALTALPFMKVGGTSYNYWDFPGKSYSGAGNGTGMRCLLNYNETNNKQIMFFDVDNLGSSTYTGVRILSVSGYSYIDCSSFLAQKPLRFMGVNGVYMSAANTNTIGVAHDTNSAYDLWVNYNGYQDGTTQYRNFKVGDGKHGTIASFAYNGITLSQSVTISGSVPLILSGLSSLRPLALDASCYVTTPSVSSFRTLIELDGDSNVTFRTLTLRKAQDGSNYSSLSLDNSDGTYLWKINHRYATEDHGFWVEEYNGSTWTNPFYLRSRGNSNRPMFPTVYTGGGSYTAKMNSNGELCYDSCRRETKINERLLEIDTSDIYRIGAKTFEKRPIDRIKRYSKDKDGKTSKEEIVETVHDAGTDHGWIAEDLAGVAPWLATYDNGKPAYFAEQRILPAIVEELKRLARYNLWLEEKLGLKPEDIPEEFRVFSKASA